MLGIRHEHPEFNYTPKRLSTKTTGRSQPSRLWVPFSSVCVCVCEWVWTISGHDRTSGRTEIFETLKYTSIFCLMDYQLLAAQIVFSTLPDWRFPTPARSTLVCTATHSFRFHKHERKSFRVRSATIGIVVLLIHYLWRHHHQFQYMYILAIIWQLMHKWGIITIFPIDMDHLLTMGTPVRTKTCRTIFVQSVGIRYSCCSVHWLFRCWRDDGFTYYTNEHTHADVAASTVACI